MDNVENLRKAFAPLGERLHYFESGLYLMKSNEFDLPVNQHDYYYYDMINKIGRDVNQFDPVSVYEVANEYLFRACQIVELLRSGKKKKAENDVNKWNYWEEELIEYVLNLASIIKSREDSYLASSQKNSIPTELKVIQLPENFTISEFQLHFKPKAHYTIALLMYYLSKAGIMPNYEQGQYGKIAPIFGIHEKTIAADIRKLNLKSKKEIKPVKELVEGLLNIITEDYTKAPKE